MKNSNKKPSQYLAGNKPTGFLAVVVFALGIVGPQIMPLTVLDDFSSLRNFSDAVSGFIPSIENFTRVSSFPQVTRLFLSIMWATVPLQVLVFLIWPGGSFSVQHIRNKLLPITLLYVTFVPALILIAVFMLGDNADAGYAGLSSRLTRLTGHSKVILGIISFILTFTVSYLIASFMLWIRHWPDIYFNGLNREKRQ